MLAELKARLAREHAAAEKALARDDLTAFEPLARQYHATANAILAITGTDPRVD